MVAVDAVVVAATDSLEAVARAIGPVAVVGEGEVAVALAVCRKRVGAAEEAAGAEERNPAPRRPKSSWMRKW